MLIKRLAQDSIIYGGGDLISKLIAFFTFPIIATYFSVEEFGSLELILTSVALLGMVMNCGLNNAVQRYYWDNEIVLTDRPLLVTSGLINMLATGFLIIVLVVTLLNVNGYFQFVSLGPLVNNKGIYYALAFMFFTQMNQYGTDVIRLHFKPWRFLTIKLSAKSLSAVLGLVGVVYMGANLNELIGIQALVLALVFSLTLYFIRQDLKLNFSYKWIKELFRFGYPFIFTGIAFWLFGSMDRWFLLSMSSVEDVGYYSVAFRFATILIFVTSAFGQAWSPVSIKMKSDNPLIYRQIYGDVLLLLFVFMLIIGSVLSLFSGELIGYLMPIEYVPSAIILCVLCFGIMFQVTQQVTAVGISLEKKTKIFSWLALLTALINAVLNYFLIKNMGAVGAAWATSLSYVILTVLYYIATQQLHPIVVQKTRMLLAILVFLFLAYFSIVLNSTIIDTSLIFKKALIWLVCTIVLIGILPVKRLKLIK